MKAQSISADHELTRKGIRAVEYASGKGAVIGGCPAMTIAMVTIAMGIPSIIIGPGSIAQAHTENEWVEISQLGTAARVYAALMAEMCR